ncbi:MAG: hypothetical protein ACT4NV_07335 [Rhodoferax sp.]
MREQEWRLTLLFALIVVGVPLYFAWEYLSLDRVLTGLAFWAGLAGVSIAIAYAGILLRRLWGWVRRWWRCG